MMHWIHGFIEQIITFAGAHPALIGLILFAFSCSEGLAIIGATLPGESVVLGVAAIAGAAGSDPWMMLIWATLGAVAGDGLSFWLGHRYGDSVARWPGLRSNPGVLEKGERFIQKHGAKSIAFARFIPFIRSIVPVAAGVFRMDPLRFYIANIASAFVWAIVHIFPAVAFGMAYNTLGEVSGRIAVIFVFALVLIVILTWLLRLIVLWLTPRLVVFYASAIKALSQRPEYLSKNLARWLDPGRPGFIRLAIWSGILIAAITGSMGILEDLISGDQLVQADIAVNHLVQGLRSEPVDAFMVLVTSMGDAIPLIAASTVLIGVLLFQRAWHSALAASCVLVAASIFVPLIKFILHKPRPIQIYSGAEAYSFPSGHTTISAVLFGILAVLISRHLAPRGKIAVYSIVILWVCLVGASRIYLSAHWPSDVVGGMLFGTVLTAIFALLLGQVRVRKYNRSLLAFSVLTIFFAVGGYHAATSFNSNLARYAPQIIQHKMALADWTGDGWRSLPARRIDLGGEREGAFAIQWTGKLSTILSTMQRDGWYRARPFTWHDGLKLFSVDVHLADIAPLPMLHNGRLPSLTLIQRPKAEEQSLNERLVLRFWRSDIVVTKDDKEMAVFVGYVTREVVEQPISWLAVMRERKPQASIPGGLVTSLHGNIQLFYRRIALAGPLLIWPQP